MHVTERIAQNTPPNIYNLKKSLSLSLTHTYTHTLSGSLFLTVQTVSLYYWVHIANCVPGIVALNIFFKYILKDGGLSYA